MKKMLNILMCCLALFTVTACNNETEQPVEDEIKTDTPVATITDKLSIIDIEIGETYNISSLINEFSGISVSMTDESIASFESGVITGLKSGNTTLILRHCGIKQVVTLNVYEKGALATSFTFDEYRLTGKKIVAFGDSVTANSTIYGKDTYYDLFTKHFNMVDGGNFAIGGTTATYAYPGSNIDKEYHGTTYYGGPQRIVQVYNEGKLDDVDYVIISYVGNDRYFQVPIEDPNAPEYDVDITNVSTTDESIYASAHSFKDSYRHMIKTLRQINPNVRIIIQNYTYSEFEYNTYPRYGSTYTVDDYKKAEREIADEMGVKYLSPWQHVRNYYDYGENGKGALLYFQDCVHLSVYGHQKLFEYWVNGGADYYMVGSMNDYQKDIDWQFAVYGREYTFSIKLNVDDEFKIVSTDGSKVFDCTNKALNKISGLTSGSDNNIKVLEEGTYTFKIKKSDGSLTITKEETKFSYTYIEGGTTYTQTIVPNSNGEYVLTRTFALNSGIVFFYEGRYITSSTTTFEGKFVNGTTNAGNSDFYLDSKMDYYLISSHNGTIKYTFVYNPTTDKLTISLA